VAHFFVPSHGADTSHGEAAAMGAAISDLVIRPNRQVRFGLWGGGPGGERLAVTVYRAGAVVSGGKTSPVKLALVSNHAPTHIQIYSATGLAAGDEIYGLLADGRRYTGALRVRVLKGTPGDVMKLWAQSYRAGEADADLATCDDAIPYVAMEEKKKGWKMEELKDSAVGGPLYEVHGLAVHTTAGTEARTPFQMASFGCVGTWNTRGVSAHFGVAGDGTLVQFVPASFVAYAQMSPGNEHWVSVEVDNNGKKEMNDNQLATVKKLFRWVCKTYAVPAALALGCLFPKAPQFDKVTREVCAAGGSETTTDSFAAVMSRGLSCHWWLEGNKTSHSHGCPGPGILAQLATIVT
jgi:hypothetical protein